MYTQDSDARKRTDRATTLCCPGELPILFSDMVTSNAAQVLMQVLESLAGSDADDRPEGDRVLMRDP
jgi:hypothetical protein